MFTYPQWRRLVSRLQSAGRRPAARRPRTFRPSVLDLEQRLTPSTNVTSSQAGGTLTLTGTPGNDSVTITEVGNQIVVTPTGGTQLNGSTGAESFSHVSNLVVNFGQGSNDSVAFDISSQTINLPGYVSVTMGTGNSTVTTLNTGTVTDELITGGNLSIAYGNGQESTFLANFKVGGSLSVTHQNGDASVTFESYDVGTEYNSVHGSVTVANAVGSTLYAGADFNDLEETGVGGSVYVNMGNPDATSQDAGFTSWGTSGTLQLSVGRNFTVLNNGGNLDLGHFGEGNIEVCDTNVGGSVTLTSTDTSATVNANGFNMALFFGADNVATAVTVKGSLAASTTGVFSDIQVSDANIKGSLTTTVNGFNSWIDLYGDSVLGATTITSQSSDDQIIIDGNTTLSPVPLDRGSTFRGAFTLTSGNGIDSVFINSTDDNGGSSITTAVTTFFNRPVSMNLGGGDDSMAVATAGDVFFNGGTVDGGTGTNTLDSTAANIEGKPAHFINFV